MTSQYFLEEKLTKMMISKNKVSRFKKNIVANCKSCGGIGCDTCNKTLNRIDKYAAAGIPVEYWLLSFKNFSGDGSFKKIVKSELSDINELYDSGRSYLFSGSLGTGKTYASCCILKVAALSGFSCHYTTMADAINTILSHSTDTNKYFNMLIETDFLAIDEFDSRWIFPSEKSEQVFGSSLEYILRTRFQNQLPTILCSNNEDVDQILGGRFAKTFKSLRSKYLKLIYVGGKDYRRMTKK